MHTGTSEHTNEHTRKDIFTPLPRRLEEGARNVTAKRAMQ